MERLNNTPFRSSERGERWDDAPVRRLDALMFRGGGLEVGKRGKIGSHGLQLKIILMQTMTALIKSFCGRSREGGLAAPAY